MGIDEVMMPLAPVKIMRHRGDDDTVVGFGHFSEERRVKSGPADVIIPYSDAAGGDYDRYTANEMAKKGFDKGRIDPRSLRNGGGENRFANSRCKPPGKQKPVINKPPIVDKDGNPIKDEFDENPFKGVF